MISIVNESKPEKILERLRQTVKNGKFGRDYTVIPREKNNQLREQYLLDDAKVKAILLCLDVGDHVCTEKSNNEMFPDDVIHIFRKRVGLIPRYSVRTEQVSVELYIKFTWIKSGLIIISFHEWNKI